MWHRRWLTKTIWLKSLTCYIFSGLMKCLTWVIVILEDISNIRTWPALTTGSVYIYIHSSSWLPYNKGVETSSQRTKTAKSRRQALGEISVLRKTAHVQQRPSNTGGELLRFIFGTGMPCQSLLVEGNDHLRAASVGLASGDQIRLIRLFPAEKGRGE